MPRRSKNKNKQLSANANVFVPGATYVEATTSTPPLPGSIRSATTQSSTSLPETSSADDSIISAASNASTQAALEPFYMNWPYDAPKTLTSCRIMGPTSADCPLLNTSYQISHLIDTICALPIDPLGGEGFPKLFCDLEGTNLSREGSVSLMQICILPEQPFAFPHERVAAMSRDVGGSAVYGWPEDSTQNGEWPSSPSNPYEEPSVILPAQAQVYVLDIHHLQHSAFTTFGIKNPSTSLRDILQNPLVPKVFFDVRNDSNALYWLYGVSLQGIHDLQCMEAATGTRSRIISLGKCLKFLHLPENKRRGQEAFIESALDDDEFRAVQAISERGKCSFAPEYGGSYEVFKTRPLFNSMLAYAISDVVFMPGIYARFHSQMEVWGRECGIMEGTGVGEYLWNVLNASRHRVWLSQQDAYEPKGKEKTLNPWMTPLSHNRELANRGHDFKDGLEWVSFQQVKYQQEEGKRKEKIRREVARTSLRGAVGRQVLTEAFAGKVVMVRGRESAETSVKMRSWVMEEGDGEVVDVDVDMALKGVLRAPEQSW